MMPSTTELYLALPYVIRQRDELYLNKIEFLLDEFGFQGVLARNLEEIQYFKNRLKRFPGMKIVSDARPLCLE